MFKILSFELDTPLIRVVWV